MNTRTYLVCGMLALALVAGGCRAPGPDPRSTPLAGDSPAAVAVATSTAGLAGAPARTETAPDLATTDSIGGSPTVGATGPLQTPTPASQLEPTPEAAGSVPGPTQEQLRLLASLENFGAAPELHNETWLNSEPLKLADLRGQVVMVEFWTFG